MATRLAPTLLAVELALEMGFVTGKAPAPPAPAPEKRNGAHPNGKPATAAPVLAQEPAPESLDFERLRQSMQHCLSAAYGVWEGLDVELPFTTEDVRALGITLFLECSRKGIVPQVSGEGLPF